MSGRGGKTAFVFPGQGSQHEGMGSDLAAAWPEAKAAFEEMDAALGEPISPTCFRGTAEELALTENTQPAILAHAVAAWRCLAGRGVTPDYLAGHSLGEYAALVAAGALSAGAAVRTVRVRGRYMQEAVPVGLGAMAAVIGLGREDVAALCGACREPGEVLSPANYNSPGQVVIAGHAAAVGRAIEAAPERGARRAIPLAVSAPFHCALMAPAAERLAPHLEQLTFSRFAAPVVANVDARENEDPERARRALLEQVTAPVLWEDSVIRLTELGVDTFVELGPGRVLSGLVKRTVRGVRILSAGRADEVEAVLEALAG